jgi:hypothetical protein
LWTESLLLQSKDVINRQLMANTVHAYPFALDPAQPWQRGLPRVYDPCFVLPLFLLSLRKPDDIDLRAFVVRSKKEEKNILQGFVYIYVCNAGTGLLVGGVDGACIAFV